MKKVLIALDFNPTAQHILEAGYELARSMGAEVTLVHVIADYTYYSSLDYSPILGFDQFSNLGTVQVDTVAQLENAANEYLEHLKTQVGDPSAKILIKDGDAGEAIVEASDNLNVDVIVLGSHSRRGLDKILMGSVAEKVLRKSKKPLFIIPVSEKNKS
ncbi:universal stress protein [Hanamia caeni]|jgi:nucleotide-binding universal stress UspA family protein|uniref:Universal stress protein n=1 Tax=Hanamia caeni TaxID=2294116 RepID=A0A3M9NHS5_9BACT|nr:universal stress protein [Hanamia caeni]RNI37281.1 universal stress protein [Hanamia caeni]